MNRLDVEARGSSRVGQFLERIGAETNAAQKGRLFELLARTLMQSRVEFQVRKIWSWSEWPERLGRTGLDAADFGIDLVAQHLDGSYSAVQCKFRRESGTIRKAEIDSFLSASSRSPFDLRYLVVNRPVSTTTEKYLRSMRPAVKVIDLQRYSEEVLDGRAEQVAMTPWPEQRKAIDMTIEGFRHNDRGRLIMACGTGKTFTSLRIAETLTRAGGRILFLAPSIALVGQARRVWLAQTNTGLDAIAVCSDSTVGHEMDISTLYMECGVESDPERIAAHLKVEMGGGWLR